MGAQKFKTPLFLQIAAERFQTFPKFSSQWSSQKTMFGIFEILKIEILTIFFCFVRHSEIQDHQKSEMH